MFYISGGGVEELTGRASDKRRVFTVLKKEVFLRETYLIHPLMLY